MRIPLAAAACAVLMLTSCAAEPVGQPASSSVPEAVTSKDEENHPIYLTPAETAEKPAFSLLLPEQIDMDAIGDYFTAEPISDTVFARINGVSYQENPYVSREDLRYLRVLHYTSVSDIRTGELIVHRLIADDVREIMLQLFQEQYPIEQMRLIDDYGGSDDESMDDNNSSAFNYRNVRGTSRLSHHALGLALDINPLYNPYITSTPSGVEWIVPKNAIRYTDRTLDFPMKITKDDICCRIFTEHGFRWGGTFFNAPDYMHFDREDLADEAIKKK